MKSIEIKTTQNVTLEYELADLRDRLVAFLIDLFIIGVGISLLSAFGYQIFSSGTGVTVFSVFLICIFLFYALAMEILNNGQSIGKMAMKIKVIKMTGGRASFSDYVARWAFRMIDIWFSFGGIASVLIASSARAQRIGDIVANTAVVKLIPRMDLRLEDILGIQSRESYTPVYTEARKLLEEDVLLIKTTLSRQQQFNNTAHKEAIHLLAEEIRAILDIKTIGGSERQFLQTILKDYVVLTR